jgi:hypothetical protein
MVEQIVDYAASWGELNAVEIKVKCDFYLIRVVEINRQWNSLSYRR